ncbi:MAG: response regulator transcription factor [Candidatus Eremiobacteraeota bacterium]|nr:response regulator transcription factor [Candidatus Eremiobacteraeota bacterium]MBV8204615.1 response regulator transcription factor [Candidatus Eremiobacteraeota bacterium]MBV8461465.1 response regulator transcription factor [Candidatus Eremiobacteraeota bacterium]MBV8595670.1 response regulator transcription factor [Candidatus Eremiobacteraeota bacterium]
MRLLIVEDDVRLCDVLRRGLMEQGHIVDDAHDGETGEHYAMGGDYDAIVIDIQLPRRDGLSVVRRLREAGMPTPTLILTSRDAPSDVIAGLDAGADDYLRKPFVFGELEARLRSITRRSGSQLPALELRVHDLTLDLAARRVRRREREIELTRRELAFLEYFMRNANRIVTRRMLEDAMFDRESDVESNVVDVYVSRLRAKIATAGELQLLHTVRGVGYRLGDR